FTHFKQALSMIYFSDVRVNLTTCFAEGIVMQDTGAGWCGGEVTEMESNLSWQGFRFDETTFPYRDDIVKGYDVIRLKGLVQFTDRSYGDRKFNTLFELTPLFRPEDKGYPLTMSREELVGETRHEIRNLINKCNIDPLTMTLEMPEEEEVYKVIEGYFTHGKRNQKEQYWDPDWAPRDTTRELIDETEPIRSYDHQSLLLINYNEKERDIRADKGILAVWRELLLECAEWGDIFGVGLIIDPHVRAMRMYHEGSIYYVINPDVLSAVFGIEAKVHTLHFMACHETAHFKHTSHNELHSECEAQTYIETINNVRADMAVYKKPLR
ncbi:MAG TPA: hypothetical protein VJ044_18475, partial [Candidatus Hodarchaeales archaeon]|nr:hypothetical protein [Candidatus Hodarchaeales archaeon]